MKELARRACLWWLSLRLRVCVCVCARIHVEWAKEWRNESGIQNEIYDWVSWLGNYWKIPATLSSMHMFVRVARAIYIVGRNFSALVIWKIAGLLAEYECDVWWTGCVCRWWARPQFPCGKRRRHAPRVCVCAKRNLRYGNPPRIPSMDWIQTEQFISIEVNFRTIKIDCSNTKSGVCVCVCNLCLAH